MKSYNPILRADAYKIFHVSQYPEFTQYVYATWIPRSTYIPEITKVVAFGFQAFIQRTLIEDFNENFFARPKDEVVGEYRRLIKYAFGVENPKTDHMEALHDLGYLPILIKAVPEGTLVPLRVPMLTIENTLPEFFWLTNALETLMSSELWQPTTSATISHRYREILNRFAMDTTGTTDGVEFQGHDFSYRGMENTDAAAASGAGHLLNFVGTDTIPAILFHERYYGADIEKELVGTSVNASEHSVMSSYGKVDERETYRHLITEVQPNGFISIVSDTWDLWNVLTVIAPSLKEEIMTRDGRTVFRPDTGNPADIICGTSRKFGEGITPEEKGVVELLWETFGGTANELGYKVLDSHVGTIYGDSINLERCEDISQRLKDKGFVSTSTVLGLGSFTFQFQTRDTFGFAMKSTWVQVNGEEQNISKDPVTDTNHIKKSLTGRVAVVHEYETDELIVQERLTRKMEKGHADINVLQTVFLDGEAQNIQTLSEIRGLLASQ